jgi:putative ABC transport system permease protein
VFRTLDTFAYTLERLWQHMLLVAWVLLGLTLAAALSSGLALYVDAVYTDLLDTRLSEPPYLWRWRYLGAWSGTVSREDVERADATIEGIFAETLGLPVLRTARYVRAGTGTARLDAYSLGQLTPALLTGMDDAIQITAGEWPPVPTERTDDGPIPVLASQTLMERAGVQVGDIISVLRGGQTLTVQVAALWQPVNAGAADWLFPPKFFGDVLLMAEDDFWATTNGAEPIDEAAWMLNFNGATLRASDIDTVLARAADGARAVEAALVGIREDASPRAALTAFNAEASSLQQQLFLIVTPVGGLVLYFVALVAGLLVGRQQGDDVKLRSRGATRSWLLMVHGLMWAALAAGAALLGGLIAPVLVTIVARTSSFLHFDAVVTLPDVSITPDAFLTGAVATGLAALGGLVMAWRSTAQDVNSYRQLHARASKAWWQRAYLDLIVAGGAAYLLFGLWSRGGLQASADAPFNDPVTFAGPTLLAFGLVLLFLRLLPMALSFAARIVGVTRDIPLLMALRELTRSEGRYRGTLLMTAFTLSLTGFTASMASTLDQSLNDTVNYRIGADLVIQSATDAITETDDSGQTSSVTGYNVPPAEDLLKIDGVSSVSRVGPITARISVGTQRHDGVVIGVDRVALGDAALFRDDYASEPLVGLLNRLAVERTGILLSNRFALQYGVAIGQEITLEISALGQWFSLRVPVVGVVDYFPTQDPSGGFFAIANLDPLYELAGTPLPHDFWLDLAPDADPAQVISDIRASGFPLQRALNPADALAEAQGEPARRGVLGFLSVGFVAAITLTLIATLIQTTASFRAQASQLGALRAMGLGGMAVASYVIVLQGLLAVSGIASGTSIGLATALTYLPLLDFSGGLPPYLVRVGWIEIAQVYAVFAGVLLIVTLTTTVFFTRARMTTVLRLGEG